MSPGVYKNSHREACGRLCVAVSGPLFLFQDYNHKVKLRTTSFLRGTAVDSQSVTDPAETELSFMKLKTSCAKFPNATQIQLPKPKQILTEPNQELYSPTAQSGTGSNAYPDCRLKNLLPTLISFSKTKYEKYKYLSL